VIVSNTGTVKSLIFAAVRLFSFVCKFISCAFYFVDLRYWKQ